MGIVNFGIPRTVVEHLKEIMGLNVFAEGGTYKGETAKGMSEIFSKVYSVENSDIMFDIAERNLKNLKNVKLLKGDTREHLHNIIQNNDNILFWLDAHWSGGATYGEDDECPLLGELDIIFKHHKNLAIMIDDARLFLAPPPSPHNYEAWPSISEIVRSLPHGWDLIILDDVMYLFPERIAHRFKSYAQEIMTNRWILHGEDRRKTLFNKIKTMMSSLGIDKIR